MEKLADRIRRYVREHNVEQARAAGSTTVSVSAAEVHVALGLHNRYPAVCGALDAARFAEEARVTPVRRDGPKQGATARWLFALEQN